MQMLRIHEHAVEFDDAGFLVDPRSWNEEIAEELGRRNDVHPLTSEHWAVVRCIRDHYERYGAPPMQRLVVRRTGLGTDRLQALFNTRCSDCMCLIAGLPKPTG